jgi:hypothetical protein
MAIGPASRPIKRMCPVPWGNKVAGPATLCQLTNPTHSVVLSLAHNTDQFIVPRPTRPENPEFPRAQKQLGKFLERRPSLGGWGRAVGEPPEFRVGAKATGGGEDADPSHRPSGRIASLEPLKGRDT